MYFISIGNSKRFGFTTFLIFQKQKREACPRVQVSNLEYKSF